MEHKNRRISDSREMQVQAAPCLMLASGLCEAAKTLDPPETNC
jgi:hypothetical protein